MTHEPGHETHICPTCQQAIPHANVDVIDVAAAVESDKLTEADVFKRTYLGHGTQSSVFVFQGHPGPFRRHVHQTHDEIGYVLAGSGPLLVGVLHDAEGEWAGTFVLLFVTLGVFLVSGWFASQPRFVEDEVSAQPLR